MTDQAYMPKILVIGWARHGKDTVAEILQQDFGMKFISSSLFAAEKVMMPFFEKIGVPYGSVGDCYDDRGTSNEMRAVWFEQIQKYNSPDKSRLASEILEESNLYVGMRCEKEFEASQHLFDYILWIDASGRDVPKEPESSMTIEFDPDIMWEIKNDGSLGELRQRVHDFAWDVLGLRPKERANAA